LKLSEFHSGDLDKNFVLDDAESSQYRVNCYVAWNTGTGISCYGCNILIERFSFVVV